MLQPSTLEFLQSLAHNNDRQWFKENKDAYHAAKKDFAALVEVLIQKFGEVESDIAALKPNECVFRLYRDVRFSKSKLPYKTHFGAAMGKNSRKSPFPNYYLHVQPNGGSFVGGGLYHPSAEVLRVVRQEIDYNLSTFEGIVESADFKSNFSVIRGEQLKTKPKGYSADNPAVKYLIFKDYLVTRPLPDELLREEQLGDWVVENFKKMKNFMDFLKMPIFDVAE